MVRIEVGQVRHREHFAGPRIHDDRGAVRGVITPHLLRERLLRDELEVRVDRQLEIEPVLRRLDDALAGERNRPPQLVFLHEHPAEDAAQHVII